MSLQYVSDEKGQVTAVQIPIKEWEQLKGDYSNIEKNGKDLPEWQRELIDIRLKLIEENPDRVLPIDGLIAELDFPLE